MALRYTAPYFLWVDGDGVPAAGWFLYFYVTNTDTPLATYSNVGLTIANTNPVEANADGYWGPIFLQPADYKVVLKDANGVQIWVADPVAGEMTTDAATEIQAQAGNYAVDSGAANACEIELDPAPASYAAITGAPIRVLIANTNTGGSTLNINGLGPKAILRTETASAFRGDIAAGSILTFVYNGTQFICQELAPFAAMGWAIFPAVSVGNAGVPRTLMNVGAVANTGCASVIMAFDDGFGNTWSGAVTAYAFSGAVDAGSTSTNGTPGTVTFQMSGSDLQMVRNGGPASVDVRVRQIAAI